MIAITGATGFLGRHLVEKLRNKNIKCLVRKEDHGFKNVKTIKGDINDKKSLDNFTKGAEIIIHLAAVIDHKDKEEYKKVNTEGTKNLIKACKKNKVKRIIFVSSMASTKTHLDDYGKSKSEAEKLLLNSGLDVTILRPSFIYGKDSNSMKKLLEFLHKFKVIPIVGDGEYKFRPVHVDDVVNSIVLCINNKNSIGKIYNILGKTELTFNEFIDMVCKKYNIKKRKVHIPISICLPISSIGSMITKNFPLKKTFVLSIKSGTTGSIDLAERDLKYKPMSFSEGLKK
ncbi:NAD-dependent epimerase/dehydratase family protein [Candidatus Woesearchaeota archaeon]|nr:NAD-dependent epimerase/dehydratase family protein [Candidatus Woesearchaeota archaeon]